MGLLGWLLWWLTAEPLLAGQAPTWSAAAAGAAYRELVAALLHGGLTGVVLQLAGAGRGGAGRDRAAMADPIRVVIIGGGFAGSARHSASSGSPWRPDPRTSR
ncbi:MAG: hypothetical protein ACR2GH_12980 [Pseudonocardia sp.]